jgi:arsenite/tail-anchored protein-transporting ATPase
MAADDDMLDWAPDLREILEKDSLKWVFFGGKGGVGKTTNSCAFALKLAERRAKLNPDPNSNKVLLLSTDPAHNVSDAFGQKFSSAPVLVEGSPSGNLWAMEIDPDVKLAEQNEEMKELLRQQQAGGDAAPPTNPLESMLGMDVQELSSSLPGIDEAMSFAEVMKMVKSMEFSCVVFDTAPTGHTLRLLAFPAMIQKALGKLLAMQDQMGGLFNSVMGMMGGGANGPDSAQMFDKLRTQMEVIEDVNKQFEDPDLTTFVCVCIPEFLSVYETERLIQALTVRLRLHSPLPAPLPTSHFPPPTSHFPLPTSHLPLPISTPTQKCRTANQTICCRRCVDPFEQKFDIDCQAIIVNQVLFPPDSSCDLCSSRKHMQGKYLEQIDLLYDEFHIVKLPLLNQEVRGIPNLVKFANWQLNPYDPAKDPRPSLEATDRSTEQAGPEVD